MELKVAKITLSVMTILLPAAVITHLLSGKILFIFESVYAMPRPIAPLEAA